MVMVSGSKGCKTAVVVALAAILIPVQPADGQKYPSQVVKIVVPSVAGGGTDVMTRVFAREFDSEALVIPLSSRTGLERLASSVRWA